MSEAGGGTVVATEAPLERLAIEKSLQYQFKDRSLLAQVHLSPRVPLMVVLQSALPRRQGAWLCIVW